jgi:TRAP-type C4-dicarboxylate transport system substrate-binding protein
MAAIALVLIAGAVAAAVIYATDTATSVRITDVAGESIDKVVEELKELVERNTE